MKTEPSDSLAPSEQVSGLNGYLLSVITNAAFFLALGRTPAPESPLSGDFLLQSVIFPLNHTERKEL